ncbi:MAG TPA: patatin-like phospholipase family protein, partial [Acidimicrobiia bacterium]|nr:patatin-like phospholipase family protein [Acidimicrobiia bacterium]
VPLDPAGGVEFATMLGESLRRLLGAVALVRSRDLTESLGVNPSRLARAMWRERLESASSAVVYLASSEFDTWTEECVHQCDVIVWVADAGASPEIRAIEREVRRREASVPRRSELVLLHDASTSLPRGTRRWLAPRQVDRHHHVRVDRTTDVDRVARLLTGRGIGVVFGGGGARGVAHIGVVRALRARNIPIDATAGVSIGAIIAGAVARGDSTDDLIAEIRASVVEQSPVDVTLPTVSIASGRRVTRNIRDGAQGADVEDTWLNFRCVSANLTQGCLEVHESGPAWAAVRSSFAVPGLFPPMANANGDVLVDGGVLDNLPVTALRAAHAGVRVIAVDVGVQHDPVAMAVPPDGIVSGWRFLASTLRARAFGNLTTLPKLLLRLTELGSLNAADVGDCYVRPKLDGISLLDFGKFDELVSRGERDAGEALDAWLLDESTIDLRDHES